jgi:hypothetical protein
MKYGFSPPGTEINWGNPLIIMIKTNPVKINLTSRLILFLEVFGPPEHTLDKEERAS